MGTTTDKLSYLTGTKEKIAEKIIDLGGDITNNTTFREYANKLKTVYDNADKVNAEGSNVQLQGCNKGKMVIQPKGNTSQKTTTGKNLLPVEKTFSFTGFLRINISLPAGTYTISCAGKISSASSSAISVNNQIKVYFSSTLNSYTFTMTENITSIGLYAAEDYSASAGVTCEYEKLMLTEGSTIEPYEEYTGGALSPSLAYPQTIKNVTGDNTVKISGKNLAWNGWAEDFVDRINNNDLAKLITYDNKRCLNYSAAAGYREYDTKYLFKINWKENTRYTITCKVFSRAADSNLAIYYTDGTFKRLNMNKNMWENYILVSDVNKTIKYITPYYSKGETYIDLDTFMVEESSTQTEYEPYIEPIEKELKLSGKNKFPIQDIDYTQSGTTFNMKLNNSKLTLNGNTPARSYSITNPVKANGNYVSTLSDVPTFLLTAGTYTLSLQNIKNAPSNAYLLGYKIVNGTKTHVATIELTNPSNKTFTINDNEPFYVGIQCNSAITFNNTSFEIMLNEGSTTINFIPYYNYELCKIGNNQDYIYKNNNKWYKKEIIDKIESYNGETITTQYISTTGGLDTGATVYYVVNPTDIEITEQPVINQLENLARTIIEVPTINIETESDVDNAQLIVNASALKSSANNN